MVSAPGIPAAAQEGGAFDDVPPWHWAYDAVQRLGAVGIMVGYPRTDRDRALNALTQIYDAFAHAAHPAARAWAERFLANLPANWPQPLARSPLLSFRLETGRVEAGAQGFVVSAIAAVTAPAAGELAGSRTAVRVEVQRDPDGRLRVNYATLAASQPQLFR